MSLWATKEKLDLFAVATNSLEATIDVEESPLGIAITPVPSPLNFLGTVRQNKFLNKTECILVAQWAATPNFSNIASYRIYNGTTVIDTVQATSPLQFITCVCCSTFNPGTISITAVDQNNIESQHVTLRIQ